jgi:methionine-rich copper-binding protein CopC
VHIRGLRAAAGLIMAVGVTALVGLATAAPAWAHSRLQRTNPADGATLTAQVGEVTLTFNERVHGDFTTVVVTGPGGVSYSDGHVQVIDDDVHQKVYPLHSGAYTVAWRAISADGHPVEGQFHFTMALPAGQEPSAGPPASTRPLASTTGQGGDGWLWGGLATLVLAAAIGVPLLIRRRNRAGTR